MDYTDAQRVRGIYFTDRNTDLQPENVEMVSVQERSVSVNPKYDMDRKKQNLALIINNEEFKDSTEMSRRQGSDKDTLAIKTTLQSLHFNVIERTNFSVDEMKEIFEDISKMDHQTHNCFVCVIMTHGKDGNMIYGIDDVVQLDDLVKMFLPNKCPSLKGKPKLFFIQACRGIKKDCGVVMKDSGDDKEEYQNVRSFKVPLWADFLLAYSTVPGFYSWRNTTKGSWFIQSLAHILGKDGDRLELQQLMTSVNRKVAYEYESKHSDLSMNEMKQVPCIVSMLTKDLYFYK